MAASMFGSALYGQLFPAGDAARLFSDSAEIRAMLLVEGGLAKVQGALGVIPEISAQAIHRASLEVAIDPAGLAEATGRNGVTVPGLVAAFREAMQAPEHAQYIHWGATSQDIIDTALMLRLRQALALAEADLRIILSTLADQAEAHAETPMPARTYGQHATPTSWGAVVAQWGAPLIELVTRLDALRRETLWVSLSGAAGTASVLSRAAETRAGLAAALHLGDPGRSWHTDRGPILRIAGWMGDLCAACAGIGQGLIGLTASDVGEVRLGATGGSSTMPQKTNPVGPSILVALNIQMGGLRAALQQAAVHQHQRDGTAWFAEWSIVPEIALSAATALQITKALDVTPDVARMAGNLAASRGLLQAEALSFALGARMSRPAAQAETKRLVAQARATNRDLGDVSTEAFGDLPAGLFDPKGNLGDAPDTARRFAERARAL